MDSRTILGFHVNTSKPRSTFELKWRFPKTDFDRTQAWFTLKLGSGAGYRWIDFPGYKMSTEAKWWQKLSITGRTLAIGYNVKDNRTPRTKWTRFYATFTKNGNRNVYPGWY